MFYLKELEGMRQLVQSLSMSLLDAEENHQQTQKSNALLIERVKKKKKKKIQFLNVVYLGK